MPVSAADSAAVVADKLALAVWAAEGQRGAAALRALPAPMAVRALALLGVDGAWAAFLQDVFVGQVLTSCASAAWALDPSLCHGLLSAQRMAKLALLSAVRGAAAAQQGAAAAQQGVEAELASSLSPAEFQQLWDGLQAAGQSFKDLVKVGGTMCIALTEEQTKFYQDFLAVALEDAVGALCIAPRPCSTRGGA